MEINENWLTLSDQEVRELQTRFRRINKDPEVFKARPESEKDGIIYDDESGKWKVKLNDDWVDNNYPSYEDIMMDSNLLQRILKSLTDTDLVDNCTSDALRSIADNYFDDVLDSRMSQNGFWDNFDKSTLIDATLSRCTSGQLFGSMHDAFEWLHEDNPNEFKKEIDNYFSTDDAVNKVKKDLTKSEIVNKFGITAEDVDITNISVFDIIFAKIQKLFN